MNKRWLGYATAIGLFIAPTLVMSQQYAGDKVGVVDTNGQQFGTGRPFPFFMSAGVVGGGGTSGPPNGTPNQTTVTCGASSTTLLAAGAATTFIKAAFPANAANPVWVNWAGAAAVLAPPSEMYTPGSSVVWSGNGYLPTSQINCIATAGTAVTLIYK